MTKTYRTGDFVIYRKLKHSVHPCERARNIEPAPRGDYYTYEVDKFWTVMDFTEDGKLVVLTRRGKSHIISPDDPNIRRAAWWERFLYANRFPAVPAPELHHGTVAR
ncbi:MAG: hypothetical protein ACFCD0_06780 [Gemmataceae bacterium]